MLDVCRDVGLSVLNLTLHQISGECRSLLCKRTFRKWRFSTLSIPVSALLSNTRGHSPMMVLTNPNTRSFSCQIVLFIWMVSCSPDDMEKLPTTNPLSTPLCLPIQTQNTSQLLEEASQQPEVSRQRTRQKHAELHRFETNW